MNTVTIIVCDIKISEMSSQAKENLNAHPCGNDIDMFTPMLFEPLYEHIFSCFSMHFESICKNLPRLHKKGGIGEYQLRYAIAASARKNASDREKENDKINELPIHAPEVLKDACETDIFAFASPFSFTLPENVINDALAAFYEPNEKQRADAVIVGSREDPISLFVRGDVYKAVVSEEVQSGDLSWSRAMDMRVLASLLTKKRPGAQKATGTFASAVHQINCLGTILGRVSYFEACEKYRKEMILKKFADYIEIQSFDGVMIAPSVKIGISTVIYPNVQLKANTIIGRNCIIGSGTIIENSTIGNDCEIMSTVIKDSTLEDDVKTGPFCHIRPNSYLKKGVRVGDFVEIKNSVIGEDTHASHLTYIGDSDVGKNVNFGCGVVTVNYDGKNKNRCTIGDNSFIGCNTNLVAPVTLGKDAYTAAGSTIIEDVPDSALAIARSRQTNKENWNKGKTKFS